MVETNEKSVITYMYLAYITSRLFLKLLILICRRHDTDHVTFFDHMTLIKEYMIIGVIYCRRYVVESLI